MVVLLGFAALVVDVGLLYEHRRQLQNAADAAALAAAQELKTNPGQVVGVAHDYAGRNGAAGQVQAVQIVRINGSSVDNGVRVSVGRSVSLLFAPVLGLQTGSVVAQATAVIAPIEPIKIWPFGVAERMLAEPGQVVLKYPAGPGSPVPGNFGLMDLQGSGADGVREYIRRGYNGPVPGPIPPNTWLQDTQTGNQATQIDTVEELLNAAACTYPGADLRCPLYGLVPIVTNESLDACLGKCTLTIKQFAVFRIEGFQQIGPPGNGHIEIMGRWVEWAWGINHSQNVGGPLTGAIGVRLWE